MQLQRPLLLLCCLLAGCSRLHYQLGPPLDDASAGTAAGISDVAGALARFGPPQRVAAIADGYVLAWEHWRISETALGVSLGPLGVDALSVDWGRARLAGDFLVMRFDRQHRASNHSFSRWDEHAGGGSALQPSVGVVDIVDVNDLLSPMPQHRWGATWLQELPQLLNSANSPDSGASALEQRGTPVAAGQRSLGQ
ncbi:hypothetical protein DWB85_07465 [Seongchinamella sediminis]|uniref:Uncharacterized protein n=1 Tax=Seongchinamella sediminis TaxID=2283635 RepID=A0A3L7E0J2_9GAMM|nr:hypothetical protein [Seongchinamella sediminis]RLQ22449.1 hypothetical protein DWB85_07465 [Seongchinamella sediminis]